MDDNQEVDAWWGSYSIRGILPELGVTLLGSGVVLGIAAYLPGSLTFRVVVYLVLLAWVVQVLRWAYRIFGWNYRLTTRRLFKVKGFFSHRSEVALDQIEHVSARRGPFDGFLRIGQVMVETRGSPPVVLECICGAEQVVEKILALKRVTGDR